MKRRATIFSVEPDYTVVEDETGEHHILMHGAINGVEQSQRVVGRTGFLAYITSSTSGLWFFNPEKKQ